MGKLINIGGRYANAEAVDKVIRYVTRTRTNETRAENLQGYGGLGIFRYDTVEMMIGRFKAVQDAYGIRHRKGKRMFHEVFSITDMEFKGINCDMKLLNQIALELCGEYYRQGFQVVYAIHWEEEKKLHIHFAVNSVSFMTGKKFITSREGNRERERLFNEKLYCYCRMLHPENSCLWSPPIRRKYYRYGHSTASIRIRPGSSLFQMPQKNIRKAVYFFRVGNNY